MSNFIKLVILFVIFNLYLSVSFADVENIDYKIRKVEVTGVGTTADEAMKDASIKSIEEVVFTMVQTEQEKKKYSDNRNNFINNVDKYTKRLQIISKGSTDTGRYYKVIFEVNVEDLKKDLISAGIITTTKELASKLDNPKIMVYYDAINPQDKTNQYSIFSVGRVNDYLINHKFKVVDEATITSLRQDDKLIAKSAGQKAKLNQAVALESKADFYMNVKIELQVAGKSGDYIFIQTPVQVNAFESTSGIPFITKTYQRLDKKGEPEALSIKGSIDVSSKAVIEEAVAGVMPKIEEDLLKHWKESVAKGRQYIIVFKNTNQEKKTKFYNILKSLCSDVIEDNNQYIIRFNGAFDDLMDNLEDKTSLIGIVLKSADLGHAIFESK